MPTKPPNLGPRARLIMKYDPPPGTTPLVAMAAMEMAVIIVWKGTKKSQPSRSKSIKCNNKQKYSTLVFELIYPLKGSFKVVKI